MLQSGSEIWHVDPATAPRWVGSLAILTLRLCSPGHWALSLGAAAELLFFPLPSVSRYTHTHTPFNQGSLSICAVSFPVAGLLLPTAGLLLATWHLFFYHFLRPSPMHFLWSPF